ncbi:MAG: hypothetical protein WC554_05070 [Clostridia bacterium]|jgi:hypothetical protein
MNDYSDSNPPKGGTALKIYKVLKANNYTVRDLHYNPNNWGKHTEDGWGIWACDLADGTIPELDKFYGWCKFYRTWVTNKFKNQVVLVQYTAPYNKFLLEE